MALKLHQKWTTGKMDKNLLYLIVANKNGFISSDDFTEICVRWLYDEQFFVYSYLSKILSKDDFETVLNLTEILIEENENDLEKAIHNIGAHEFVQKTLGSDIFIEGGTLVSSTFSNPDGPDINRAC